jgi:phosphate:Na+ symporter
MFVGTSKSKNAGSIACGFGILFMGLMLMTDAVDPLAESQAFADILGYFTDMPVMGILTGLVMTVIVQSSSAMVGILQALSSTGVMTFELVYPIIMGINIGTCVTTAMVCSIGTGKDAKRTGMVHIIFNLAGTVIFMVAMTALRSAGFMANLWTSVVNSGGIADFQTIFNLITAVLLVPFTSLLVKASCLLVKDDPVKEDRYPELATLNRNLMISPTVALGAASKTVAAMARCARTNLERGLEQLLSWDDTRSADIVELEGRMDQTADDIDHYLVELSRHVETESDNSLLNMLLQTNPDLERIGDYADNLNEMAEKMHNNGHVFSDSARQEMKILGDAVLEIIRLTIDALENDDATTIKRIEPLEEVIDDMVLMLKDRHTARLRAGRCTVDTGLVFMETLTYMERASDQCSSIAISMLARTNDQIMENHHEYLREIHMSNDVSYQAERERRREQYVKPLKEVQ